MKAWVKDVSGGVKKDLVRAHRSLTIQFNSAMLAITELIPLAADELPKLREYVPEGFYGKMTILLIVGNIIIRFKTNRALRDK